jgi:hypothetical protein
MDPVTQTLFTIILMLASYIVGSNQGFSKGQVQGLVRLCEVIEAEGIEIDEEDGTVVIYYRDGTETEL